MVLVAVLAFSTPSRSSVAERSCDNDLLKNSIFAGSGLCQTEEEGIRSGQDKREYLEVGKKEDDDQFIMERRGEGQDRTDDESGFGGLVSELDKYLNFSVKNENLIL